MNNMMIGKCEWCGQDYCQECTDIDEWEKFCSDDCRDKYKKKFEENDKIIKGEK